MLEQEESHKAFLILLEYKIKNLNITGKPDKHFKTSYGKYTLEFITSHAQSLLNRCDNLVHPFIFTLSCSFKLTLTVVVK